MLSFVRKGAIAFLPGFILEFVFVRFHVDNRNIAMRVHYLYSFIPLHMGLLVLRTFVIPACVTSVIIFGDGSSTSRETSKTRVRRAKPTCKFSVRFSDR
jgi:hypothetical protein